MDFTKVIELNNSQYPKLPGINFTYGTAGIRTRADTLSSAMFRLGVVATIRSRSLGGATVGCMVTASHNPECDNGAKLVDPLGEMMEQSWEGIASDIVNSSDDMLLEKLKLLVKEKDIGAGHSSLVVGCDTRQSSPVLLQAVIDGAKSFDNCEIRELGLVTTPQLHFVVRCVNDPGYGEATLDGYYKKLGDAFKRLVSLAGADCKNYCPKVTVDAANGVGADKLRSLVDHLDGKLQVTIVNEGNGQLNVDCGADFVKIGQKAPVGLSMVPLERYASLDGDADRIVYYFVDASGKFRLLDGDRIATLLAEYIKKLLDEIGGDSSALDVAIIQTAYANGSSTNYIQNKLGVRVLCVPTGVKHLHHEALRADVGVYFEANGHGTICFSDKVKTLLKSATASPVKGDTSLAAQKLNNFIALTNEAVGDALSDLLLVEVVLRDMDMDVAEWLSKYEDVPCRQVKVSVRDRTQIRTTNAERTCTAPTGLQAAIDTVVAKYPLGRCFVRPSGTEDIVRVYAEAAGQTQDKENAELLATEVVHLVNNFLS